jgi:hypothetical protein
MICLRFFLAMLDVHVHDQYPCPSVSVSMFVYVCVYSYVQIHVGELGSKQLLLSRN